MGQTISTTINYLKNINTLLTQCISLYCFDDPTFPKNFDGGPSERAVNGIKLLQQKLHLLYSKKIKQQSGELFKRKINEAEVLPQYTAMEKVISKVSVDVAEFLEDLEVNVGTAGTVGVSSDKPSTAAQKYVST